MEKEQRDILQKEREFIYSKFENKQNLLNNLRNEITRSYELLQEMETKSAAHDEQLLELEEALSKNEKEVAGGNSKKVAAERYDQ